MEDRRSVSLDALRGIAALAVAVPHFFLFRESGGDITEFISILAVEVFFFIPAGTLLWWLSSRLRTPAPSRRA